MSATEWMASASMADDRVRANPMSLATASPAFAISAAITARVPPDADIGSSCFSRYPSATTLTGPAGGSTGRRARIGPSGNPSVVSGSMTTVFASLDDLAPAVGTHLGHSDWVEIDQSRIDQFAESTGDHQWIHVDPQRAAAGPFGSTIAHGYLTLSMTNQFLPEIVQVEGISMGVNYGVDRVRFPAPVVVGSRVRGGAELVQVDEVSGGVQTVIRITVEIEGSDRPACVVDSVSRFLR